MVISFVAVENPPFGLTWLDSLEQEPHLQLVGCNWAPRAALHSAITHTQCTLHYENMRRLQKFAEICWIFFYCVSQGCRKSQNGRKIVANRGKSRKFAESRRKSTKVAEIHKNLWKVAENLWKVAEKFVESRGKWQKEVLHLGSFRAILPAPLNPNVCCCWSKFNEEMLKIAMKEGNAFCNKLAKFRGFKKT